MQIITIPIDLARNFAPGTTVKLAEVLKIRDQEAVSQSKNAIALRKFRENGGKS